MRIYRKPSMAGVAILGAVAATVLAAPRMVLAQQTQTASVRPAAEVLARIGQAAGVTVVADSTITEQVAIPAAPTTPENVEQQLGEVAKGIPGATVARLYLPAPPAGRRWDGNTVAEYAFAQAKLFGPIGNAPAGTVEVMGQRLPADRAQVVVASLNLKPVYLVTNPSRRSAMTTATAAATGGANANLPWSQMTEDQRRTYAQQQAQQLLNADPATRRAMMEQQRMVMREMFRSMTPEQRQQFGQGMGWGDRGGRGNRGNRGQGGPNGGYRPR